MTWKGTKRAVRWAAAVVVLASAGLASSSVVSLSIWLALRATGGHLSATAVLGATIGIAGWLLLVFGTAVVSSRYCRITLSKWESWVVATSFFGPLVAGVLVRKALQLFRPDLLPPPEAYVAVVVPSAVLLLTMWFAFGRRMLASIRNEDAEPS